MGRTVGELLSTYAEILAELRERGVVRSANAPAGDYAEWLCSRALSATLVDNFSVKSHDLVLADGRRVQVKARVTSEPPKAGQLQTSPFRSWDFDLAALVLLRDYDYAVRRGASSPWKWSEPSRSIAAMPWISRDDEGRPTRPRGCRRHHGPAEGSR